MFWAYVCGAVAIAIGIVLGIMALIDWLIDYPNEAPADAFGDASTLDHPDMPQRQKLKRYETEPMGA